jgi:hypothetical protein
VLSVTTKRLAGSVATTLLLPLFTGVVALFALVDEEPGRLIDTGSTTNYSDPVYGERIR